MSRILIISTKQPSTNPRMRKAADALAAAGHQVHVLYAYTAEWALQADARILESAAWTHQLIGGSPHVQRFNFLLNRIVRKAWSYVGYSPRAMCRGYGDYITFGLRWNPDVIVGHNPGTLGPLYRISRQLGIPAIFDAEDFHRGEHPPNSRETLRVIALEDKFLPKMTAGTAASPLICTSYREVYPQIPWTTIDNAFPRASQPSAPTSMEGPLRLVWFSQVVGLDRGLSEFIAGMGLAKKAVIHLSVIGLITEEVRSALIELNGKGKNTLDFLPPMHEAALFEFLTTQEIGLAIEPGTTSNRRLARTNKLFVYPLCGVYMLISETPSQLEFRKEFPETGTHVDLNQPASIGERLDSLWDERETIHVKRKAAWEVARERLHWEGESNRLVEAVESACRTFRN